MADEKKPKKKKPKCIVTDFDDVLTPFMQNLCHLYNSKHGTSISENDLKTWNFENVLVKDARGNEVKGEDLRQMFLDLENHGLYAALPILDSAKRALDIASKIGYKIIILTARDERFRIQTEINLTIQDLVYSELVFNWDKVKVINELKKKYRVLCFVDDKLSTVQKVADECDLDLNFVLEKAHNRDQELPENIIRIHDLFDIIKYLK